ncbi:MAG: SpoIIE family protein phosphatase [Bacteroidota bacterium]
MNSDTSGFENAQKNLNAYTNKNKFVYEAFSKIFSSKEQENNEYQNSLKLYSLSNNLSNNLKRIRTFLIHTTDNIPFEVADTISFKNIVAKDNYDVPGWILIGDTKLEGKNESDYKRVSSLSIKDTNSAVFIKYKLNQFIDSIINLTPEETRLQIKQSITLNLNDVETEYDGISSWEMYNFDHVSLSKCVTFLTQLEADVRYCEQLVLNELFNKANSNNKNNIAAQLADLSMKYETEKKEKEISLLQKDKELNNTRLEAKDAEINQTKKTISIFIIVLIIVSILILFVIRANYLRKKANTLLQKQKNEIELKNHLIEHQKQEIVDSVNYAQRIQKAILPEQDSIYAALKQSFILYQPKDIVSGDFYFFHSVNSNHHILAACDCTGHGVPGAFMSLIGSNVLKQVVVEKNKIEPAQILNEVNKGVCDTLKQNQNQNRDGMDVALISLEKKDKNTILKYAGANRPLWLVRNNELSEIKPDKNPIGGFQPDEDRKFTQHELELNTNDTIYLFSDGFADQFGGEQGKKMMTKRFKDIVVNLQEKSMQAQHNELNSHYSIWKGQHEQVDDVLVIGVRI